MRAEGGRGALVSIGARGDGCGSRGRAGGRVGVVGCSIGAVVRLRRMSQAEGALWAAVGGAGSRKCAVEGALSLGARGRWRVWIEIGEAFRALVLYFWSVLEQTC
jgi:hypothetical protein